MPKDVRGDILSIWGLGSLLGKTKSVDMPFTRQKGIVRMMIYYLDPEFIPPDLDIWIKRGFYRLKILVEDSSISSAVEGLIYHMMVIKGDDDDANQGNKDDMHNMEEDKNSYQTKKNLNDTQRDSDGHTILGGV